MRAEMPPASAPGGRQRAAPYKPDNLGAELDDDSRNYRKRPLRDRAQQADAACSDRQHGRHDNRMVRFPALWSGDRPGFRQAFLPAIGSVGRRAPGVCRFFVGFLGRPIGAAIFGHWGDRIGRKATLIATLLVTGLATMAVGLVPSYESIGIWGAVLLVIIRLIQGIGVGGEWGGSVLLAMEWARTNKNGG